MPKPTVRQESEPARGLEPLTTCLQAKPTPIRAVPYGAGQLVTCGNVRAERVRSSAGDRPGRQVPPRFLPLPCRRNRPINRQKQVTANGPQSVRARSLRSLSSHHHAPRALTVPGSGRCHLSPTRTHAPRSVTWDQADERAADDVSWSASSVVGPAVRRTSCPRVVVC